MGHFDALRQKIALYARFFKKGRYIANSGFSEEVDRKVNFMGYVSALAGENGKNLKFSLRAKNTRAV